MFEFLFLDLDDTILDFHKAESIAIRKALLACGVTPTDETVALYSSINKRHWQMLERGEITRDQVKIFRFARLFEALGVTADPYATAKNYEVLLGIGHYFLPGAEEAVAALSKKYRLFLASNGTASVQAGRMTSANLYRFFEKTFVSEDIGENKPSPAYFQRCFAQIPDFDPEKALMVGDSLTSDILGGKNAGIRTCWVNPQHAAAPEGLRPDYEIETLSQLEGLLEELCALSI